MDYKVGDLIFWGYRVRLIIKCHGDSCTVYPISKGGMNITMVFDEQYLKRYSLLTDIFRNDATIGEEYERVQAK